MPPFFIVIHTNDKKASMELSTALWGIGAVLAMISGLGRYIWSTHDARLKQHEEEIRQKHSSNAAESMERRLREDLERVRVESRNDVQKLEDRQRYEIEGLKSEINDLASRLAASIKETEGRMLAQFANLINLIKDTKDK
jgi:hypothetical protein